MQPGDYTIIEAANQLQSQANRVDKEINELMYKIDVAYDELITELPLKKKYDVIVSTEYLFVRLRTIVEFEHIKVKRLISSEELMQNIKTFFVKRDVYLAQVSQKLTTIQNDISIISKLVYQQSFNK